MKSYFSYIQNLLCWIYFMFLDFVEALCESVWWCRCVWECLVVPLCVWECLVVPLCVRVFGGVPTCESVWWCVHVWECLVVFLPSHLWDPWEFENKQVHQLLPGFKKQVPYPAKGKPWCWVSWEIWSIILGMFFIPGYLAWSTMPD